MGEQIQERHREAGAEEEQREEAESGEVLQTSHDRGYTSPSRQLFPTLDELRVRV